MKKKTRLKRERNGDVGFGFFRERKLRYLRPSEFMVSLCIFIFVCFNGLTFYSCNSNNI